MAKLNWMKVILAASAKESVVEALQVGNAYVNRNQIGAVVGSQPFGGEGLSGTGPKAGGPHYLPRFRSAAKAADAGIWDKAEDIAALQKALKAAPHGAPHAATSPVRLRGRDR